MPECVIRNTSPNNIVILDDRLGREIARLQNLRLTGTAGILLKAKQAGYIPTVAPLLKKQARAYGSDDIVKFLKHLLRYIPGKLLVIWDGSPIHRGQAVKDFLSNGGAQRLHLEQLPSYAPELNPDEGIWRYLKRVEMKNICCHNLLELQRELRLATMRLRHKRDIIKNCIKHAGLEL